MGVSNLVAVKIVVFRLQDLLFALSSSCGACTNAMLAGSVDHSAVASRLDI